jgi:hypothetical protein
MRKLSLLLFLITCPNLLVAQSEEQTRRFHFGVLGGAQMIGKTFNYEKLAMTKGALFGLNASYAFSEKQTGLSIHIQPHWSFYNRTNKDDGNSYSYRLQAVNLPLLLRYTLSVGKIRPFAEAGLNIRYRTLFKIKKTGYLCELTGCVTGEKTIDLQPETSQDIVGLVAGAGVEIEIGKVMIPVTIRLNEGIGTYKMKEQWEDQYYYEDIKTRNIQITTGITF